MFKVIDMFKKMKTLHNIYMLVHNSYIIFIEELISQHK